MQPRSMYVLLKLWAAVLRLVLALASTDDPELTATLGMDTAPGDISVGSVVR